MIPQHQAHHVILGAGLIGCYLGGALIHSQQKVTFIARNSFKQIIEKGFTISDYNNHSFDVPLTYAVINDEELNNLEARADVLWLGVKCTALESVIPSIVDCISDKTIIICCQNGVANHKIIQQAFPNNIVLRAMVPFNVVIEGSNNFYRGSEGHFVLECDGNASDSIKWLARQISSGLLPTDTTYHMTALQWAKLQLNLGNAVNALADIPVKEMLSTREYRVLIAKMMQELLQVTDKKQIKLPKIANLPNKWIPKILFLPNFMFNRVAQSMLAIDPKVRTSMWWDLHRGKTSEIKYLNQKLVKTALQIGVDAPLNAKIVEFILKAEEGDKIPPNAFLEWARSAIKQY